MEIIKADAAREDVSAKIVEHNETFLRSYHRFFKSIYKDKYYYMGEADLLSAAFILDTAHYYIFVVVPAYRFMKKFFWMPVLGPKPAFISYHFMSLYNRRFKAIAMRRRAAGEAGERNDGRRIRAYFNLNLAPFHMVLRGVKIWAIAELDNLRLLFKRKRVAMPVPESAAPPAAAEHSAP